MRDEKGRFIKGNDEGFQKGNTLGVVNSGRKLSAETKTKISLGHTGKKLSDEHRRNIGLANEGRKFPEEFKIKMSKVMVGNKNGKGNKGRVCSEETLEKMRKASMGNKNMLGKHHSEETKRKLSELKKRTSPAGENSPWWKGGLTPLRQKVGRSFEYKQWRKAVYERDNYTCQECGNNESGNLNAHHIKPFSKYPELRLSIDNGITLCRQCHSQTDSYLNKNIAACINI